MKPARPLFIAFIISLMLWGGLAVYSFYKYDSNKVTPRTLAIESLKAVTGCDLLRIYYFCTINHSTILLNC